MSNSFCMADESCPRWKACCPQGLVMGGQSKIDKSVMLVHSGANRCGVGMSSSKKRLSISLELEDYDALRALAEGHRPPLSLQYILNVAVKDLLEKHATRQLALPLDK